MEEASNFDDGIAVIGVPCVISKEDNPALEPIIKALPQVRVAGKYSSVRASHDQRE